MTELTAAEVEAKAQRIARPGESWESARARAARLLTAVQMCEPCQDCDELLTTPEGYRHRSFLDGVHSHCYGCPGAPLLRDYPEGGFTNDD